MGILIKNIKAVLLQEEKFVIETKDIYIEKDKIVGISNEPKNFIQEKIIDGTNKLLLPGLINCHTHSYMSVFRNCADDLAFDDWLFKNILPLEDKLIPEDAYWGALLSIMEMLRTGTTCFLDMHMFPNEIAKAVEDSGIRGVLSRGLVGFGDDEGGRLRLSQAKEEMNNYKDSSRLSFLYGPHAPYTCDQDYLKIVLEEAKKDNKGIHIHLSESKNEIENMKKQNNCTPIEYVNQINLFDKNTLAAHCVQLTEKDIEILREKKVNVITNPASNMKLGNGFAPITKLMEQGINICLGTDGAASNNSLNLFHEMSLLALIHKGVEENAQAVSAQDALKFATMNGARALQMEDSIGQIKEGMKADLIILNLNNPQFSPRNNLIAGLCYSGTGSEVETVLVDGNIVMEDKKFTFIDEKEVYVHIEQISKRLGLDRRY
ncbi:amidohydrolase [Anaerosacchariphilus polymeriproducens]|uniref:5-methylthioadenosine/S-adenosylhomocysteine deaminase n=1 Tax=Anaerosacchariphilus polymeriproducens TaxID=1812858 RepID=A0A371ATP6_9FIRM|nr:amidohydrolase [Anaerosacchariphilus polymeriproducens]RDU22938.1 amidohydrolase [Anaerosacchariphilus polymeriproducens]